ncbi:unnamed protein product, partial [Closterium sp. NIES-54]
PLSPQQLREWFAQRTRLQSGAAGARDSADGDIGDGGVGATRLGGAGVTAGDGGTGGAAAAGPRGARTRGTGAAGTGSLGGAGAGGAGAGDLAEPRGAGAGGAGAGGTGADGAGAGGAGAGDTGAVGAGAGGTVAGCAGAGDTRDVDPGAGGAGAGGAVLSLPSFTGLPAVTDPESDLARAASPAVSRLLAIVVTDPSFESTAASALVAELLGFAAACRLDFATALEDSECLAAAVPHLVAMLLAPEGDPDAPDNLTPRSYAEAITGPYSSQWQTAMDFPRQRTWKFIGTYVNALPPSGADIVDGMWILRVKLPPGSPPAFKARYVARGSSQRQGVDYFQTFSPTPKMTTLRVLQHVAAQRDYEFHTLNFSTAFLQGSLHEEIWLPRPPGFTGSFPAVAQHTEDYTCGSGVLTDTLLPPFYVLVYVDDLVFATADTEALAFVKLELQKRHTCTDLGELRNYLGLQITRDRARRTITLTQSHMVHQVLQRFGFRYSSPQSTPLPTGHSLSAPHLDESVEPSGPYLELVGCLITSGMGLVLGGRGPVVLTGHADASWELRWLTYLLNDLGEQPRSPPVLYVDNKAMIAFCQEHRLEHRTNHIALRYFLARELQQRGQLRLVYVATRANTADIFTKTLQSGDH